MGPAVLSDERSTANSRSAGARWRALPSVGEAAAWSWLAIDRAAAAVAAHDGAAIHGARASAPTTAVVTVGRAVRVSASAGAPHDQLGASSRRDTEPPALLFRGRRRDLAFVRD